MLLRVCAMRVYRMTYSSHSIHGRVCICDWCAAYIHLRCVPYYMAECMRSVADVYGRMHTHTHNNAVSSNRGIAKIMLEHLCARSGERAPAPCIVRSSRLPAQTRGRQCVVCRRRRRQRRPRCRRERAAQGMGDSDFEYDKCVINFR